MSRFGLKATIRTAAGTKCGFNGTRYSGRILHDPRRAAAHDLQRGRLAGVRVAGLWWNCNAEIGDFGVITAEPPCGDVGLCCYHKLPRLGTPWIRGHEREHPFSRVVDINPAVV